METRASTGVRPSSALLDLWSGFGFRWAILEVVSSQDRRDLSECWTGVVRSNEVGVALYSESLRVRGLSLRA
jgi:hypothetical protein